MITKEFKSKKYCCFYASDFHLEMILLPYIKNNINKDKIVILTEENLSESIKKLLERTNLNQEQKNKILQLNWDNKDFIKIELGNENKFTDFIINGDIKYINKINDQIKKLNLENINIINCYNIDKIKENKINIENEYDGILNTNYITN